MLLLARALAIVENYNIRNARIFIISLTILMVLAAGAQASAKQPFIDVRKSESGPGVYARIGFHKAVDFKVFYLTGPDRFVIDVIGAEISDAKKIVVDSSKVAQVRFAQNSLDPKIVRIVFDLKKSVRLEPVLNKQKGIIEIGASGSAPEDIEAPEPPAKDFPKVSVKKLKDRVEISLEFKERPMFQREVVDNPPRYVFDFEGYKPVDAKDLEINEGLVKTARIAHYNDSPHTTRLVLETGIPARVELATENSGKKLVIKTYQSSVYGKKICVDAGHGGKDPGAQVSGTDEKDMVLDVALMLRDLLKGAGAKVIMTRDTDVFIPLKERAEIANRNRADVFISIHANALDNHEYRQHIRGIQMFHYKKGSQPLAETVRDTLSKSLATGDWGVYDKKFVVLRYTDMRATLAELGFMTHPDDMALMLDETFQQNAARGLFNGLDKYFGGRGQELVSLELSREMVAHLPDQTYNYVYASTGNVLEGDFPDYEAGAEVPEMPEIPDFIDILPTFEEGLTHEAGGEPSASAAGVQKSNVAPTP